MKFKLEVKWGILFVLMSLLWMLFEKAMGWHGANIEDQRYFTNLFAIPAIAVYILAFRDRRKSEAGPMQWKHGFLFGLGMTIVITLFSPLSQWIVSEIISPEYFPNVIDYVVSHGEMTQEAAEDYFSLSNYIIQSTVFALLMGLITSAIVALFIRKKHPKCSVKGSDFERIWF